MIFRLIINTHIIKRFIAALFLSIIGLSLSAQPKEILDYGKIKACFSFKDGAVLYEDEIMPEKFMSYLLIGENTIFVTSEFFDKRLEIPYDICTEENNDYNYTSFKTSERVVVNISDGEIY